MVRDYWLASCQVCIDGTLVELGHPVNVKGEGHILDERIPFLHGLFAGDELEADGGNVAAQVGGDAGVFGLIIRGLDGTGSHSGGGIPHPQVQRIDLCLGVAQEITLVDADGAGGR